MNLRNPSYLWIEILPGLLLLGWVYSEVRQMRRLRIFGDPAIMKISVPWGLRAAALVAVLFGMACAAAVVSLPTLRAMNAMAKAPVVEILMDIGSMESLDDGAWETFDASLQILFDQAPGARFSAIALGASPEVLVYPTVDTQGLRTILARLRFEAAPEGKVDLRQAYGKYATSENTELSAIRRIVVSALPLDELQHISDSISPHSEDTIFAQISNDSGGMTYLLRDSSGIPGRTEQADEIQRFLKAGSAAAVRRTGLDPTQWFALAAIMLLSLEYVFRISARSGKGRHHFA